MRLLLSHGFTCVSELPLPSGRRADLVAIGRSGEIWIVEIKSSIADFRADQKWMDYRMHCDRLFFATTIEVPCEIFPKDTGLIVADGFGGEIRVRGAGAPAAGADPQGDDASDRAMRGAAPAIADRSGGALWQRDGMMPRGEAVQRPLEGAMTRSDSRVTAARAWPECAAGCGDAC